MQTRFVKACKTCLEEFYEKVSIILIGYNVGKGYYCLCDLFFDFEFKHWHSSNPKKFWLSSQV